MYVYVYKSIMKRNKKFNIVKQRNTSIESMDGHVVVICRR